MSTEPATLGADLARVRRWSLLVGCAALLACIIGAPFSPAQFFRAYLAAYLFFLGVGLGCLSVLMIYYLTGGAWGFLIRRTLEAGMRTLPLLAVLFTPVACGLGHLYLWAHPEIVATEKNLRHQHVYFQAWFVWARVALYFVLWVGMAFLLSRWSRKEDETGDVRYSGRLEGLSGPGLVVYGVSITFAAVDWIMSLQPAFRSTIFGPVVAAGQILSAHALALLVLAWLLGRSRLRRLISEYALIDLGSLLFTFLIIWSYVCWFQFMLIWIANLPYDIIWYLARGRDGWQYVGLALLVLHFFVPFFLLLIRDVKRNPTALATVAGVLFVMQLVFSYYQVMPAFPGTTIGQHWMDFLTPLGLGGVWLAYFLWQLQRFPLLPRHDANREGAVHLREVSIEEAIREAVIHHA